jgi:hypothetical protein
MPTAWPEGGVKRPRELALVVVGGLILAVVMSWPLVLHLGHTIPKDLTDPLPQAWQVAWGGHALLHQPTAFFQSNQFWPLDDTLAFSDALLGYAPAGLIGSGPEAAVARYDVLFILAYALCFVGTYLLARELGLGPIAATVAGVAFAFAPMRLEQDRHLHVISSGGIPLALAAGLRGYRLRRPGWVFAGFVIAAWQFSIGPTLGVPLTYGLFGCGVIAAVVWVRRGRPALDRRLVIASIAGAAVYLVIAVLIALPYLRVSHEQSDSERPPSTVAAFSGPPTILGLAPEESFVWGPVTNGFYDSTLNPGEKTLFPGLLILGLAAFGVASGPWPKPWRLGILAATVVVAVLSLGFRVSGGLLWPDRILYELLPGWDGIRTPGRLFTFATLGLALLAGAGSAALVARLRHSRGGQWQPVVVACAIVLGLLVEGRGLPFNPTTSWAEPAVPEPPADVSDIPAPQLWLPADLAVDNRRYLLWSTDGFPDIINGRSSVQPEFTQSVIDQMTAFPDADSVATLRRLGVRSVILDLKRAPGTDQADAAERSIAGLGLTEERRGDALIYLVNGASR